MTSKSLQRKQESKTAGLHPSCVFGSNAVRIILEWPFLNCHDLPSRNFPSLITADAWQRSPHLSDAQRCHGKAKVERSICVKERMGKLVQAILVREETKEEAMTGLTHVQPVIQLLEYTTDFHSLFEALTSWRTVLNQTSCKMFAK